MRNLTRFFHFHEGEPEHRAVKVVGSVLAGVLLLTFSGATTFIAAEDGASTTLALASDPCVGAIVQSDGRVALSWMTTTDTDVNHAMVGMSTSYGSIVPAAPGRVHTAVLDNLRTGTTYHFRAYSSRSSSGDSVQSGDCAILIPGLDDLSPTIIDAHISDLTETRARIDFATNEPAQVTAELLERAPRRGASPTVSVFSTARTSHVVTIEHLMPGTPYVLQLGATDEAGNALSGTPQLAFTTHRTGADDLTPPIVHAISCSPAETGAFTVVATTPEPSATGLIEFGPLAPVRVEEVSAAPDSIGGTVLRRTLRDLVPATTYLVRVVVMDAAGNTARSAQISCEAGP